MLEETRRGEGDRNHQYFLRAVQHMPLGVADSYRYWGPEESICIKQLKGCTITDLNGTEYLDFRLGYGPIILGYRDSRVDSRVIDTIQNIGTLCGFASELETEVATKIKRMCPNIEKIRFANSGTEAVLGAMRAARASTGRDKIVVLEGSFHGLSDELMWRADIENWNVSLQDGPPITAFGSGISKRSRESILFASINNIDQMERLFDENPSEIAAVLIEPILGNSGSIEAEKSYLQAVKELCTTHGSLLIFDEVKTGFRVNVGGYQALSKVFADLTTYAKSIANGYPIAAFGGKAEIMNKIHSGSDGIVHGGTYTGNLIGLAAAHETLSILESTDALSTASEIGSKIKTILGARLNQHGITHSFTGPDTMIGLHFCSKPPRNYREWKNSDNERYQLFARALRKQGILIEPDSREPWFFCEAHKEVNLAEFDCAIDKVLTSLS